MRRPGGAAAAAAAAAAAGAASAGAGMGAGGAGGDAADEQQQQQHRFHLPIPSVFRPSGSKQKGGGGGLRGASKQRGAPSEVRPASIEELANAAEAADTVFNTSIPIRRFIAGARGLRTQADTYLAAQPHPDYEHAFICLVKATRLLVNLLPNHHPGWKTDLTPEARNKAKAEAQASLDKLSELKPILNDAYDKWRAAHPKLKDDDISKIPTSLSLPALAALQQEQMWEEQEEYEHAADAVQPPSMFSSSSSLRQPLSGGSSGSIDVRTILGYGGAGSAAMAASSSSSSAAASSSSRSTYSTNTISAHPHALSQPPSVSYAASATSASLQPWAAPSSSTQTVGRFAYPLLRRSSTQTSSASSYRGQRRQQTADSITSASMTPDQSGQGFAPRTMLGESYYMTLPPSLAGPSAQQAFPWTSLPPPLPPPPAPPLVPLYTQIGAAATSSSSSSSSSAPTSPSNVRPPAVVGPRPLGGPSTPGPPRPVKSLTQFPPPIAVTQQLPAPLQPLSPPQQHQPTSSIPDVGTLSLGPAPNAQLPDIGPDGGGLRLERHATQLLTLGRHQQRPWQQAEPQTAGPASVPAPAEPPSAVTSPPSRQRQRPQRSATEEEEAQLAWALEESRRDMEAMERKAAAASASHHHMPTPTPTVRGTGTGTGAPSAARTAFENAVYAPPSMSLPATAFTEGGQPLRTVVLPTRVLSIFLALARENTENNVETCALLMGKLRAGTGAGASAHHDGRDAFLITHLTVPAQSGASDRCETHNEEAIWAFQEEHDLVTVGWIHTHPSQSAFLSSLDLHTHCSFQAMTPEAIAIVCAPRHEPSFGLFRLTDPHGVQTIMHCRAPGLFHPHVTEDGHDLPALYTDALHGHVKLDPDARLMVVDLR